MAGEYTLVVPATSPASEFVGLITRFGERLVPALYLVESTRASRSYSCTRLLRSDWPEDILVSADNQQWYVAFYRAVPSQRTLSLTTFVRRCLPEGGVGGTFAEV